MGQLFSESGISESSQEASQSQSSIASLSQPSGRAYQLKGVRGTLNILTDPVVASDRCQLSGRKLVLIILAIASALG